MVGFHTAGLFADTALDGEEIGTLVIVVDRAKNLPNRKTMGKQDPYCAFRLGKEAKRTETDRRGGQTPRWDQELRFTMHDSLDFHSVKVSIFNDDRKSDLIGEALISLDNVLVPGGGTNDGWHGLTCKGRYAGEVRLELSFYDTRPHEVARPKEDALEQQASAGAAVGGAMGPRAQMANTVKRRPLPNTSTAPSPLTQTQPYSYNSPDPYAALDDQRPGFDDLPLQQPGLRDDDLPEVYQEPPQVVSSVPQRTQGYSQASSAPLRMSHSFNAGPAHYDQQVEYPQQYQYAQDPYARDQFHNDTRSGSYDNALQHQEPLQYSYPDVVDQYDSYQDFQQEGPPPLIHSHSESEVYNNHYSLPERQDGAQSYPAPAPHPYQRPLPNPATARAVPNPQTQGRFDDIQQIRGNRPTYRQDPRQYAPEQTQSLPPQPMHSHSAPNVHLPDQQPQQHYQQGNNRGGHVRQPTHPLPAYGQHAYTTPTRSENKPSYPEEFRGHEDEREASQRRLPPNAYSSPHASAGQDPISKPRQVERLRASASGSSNHTPTRSEPPPAARSDVLGQRRSYGAIPLYTTYVAGQDDPKPQPTPHSRLSLQSQSRDPAPRGYNPNLPLYKPRAISPTRDTPDTTPLRTQPRKSVPQPPRSGPPQPASFTTAFSPDSFDALNPRASAQSTPSHRNPNPREPSPMYSTTAHASSAPVTPAQLPIPTDRIVRSDGKTIDPSDHLPGHTWAPEPELKTKKPVVTVNMRRFGPRDAPSSPLTPTDTSPSSKFRPRLRDSKPLTPTLPATLNAASSSPYPPPVPGKVPLSPTRANIEDYEPGGSMSALGTGVEGIDIGPSRRGLFGRRRVVDGDY